MGRDTLDPVLYLLTSHDAEVQRAASAALGNLAVNGELTVPYRILSDITADVQPRTSCSSSRWVDWSLSSGRC